MRKKETAQSSRILDISLHSTLHSAVPTEVTGGGINEAEVLQVAAGDQYSMAKTVSGELYAWGAVGSGQLGHGGMENLAVLRVVGGIIP